MPKQVNATDVTIKKLEIRGATGKHDLNPYIQELSIYENIFRPALTATMVLVDSHNLPLDCLITIMSIFLNFFSLVPPFAIK